MPAETQPPEDAVTEWFRAFGAEVLRDPRNDEAFEFDDSTRLSTDLDADSIDLVELAGYAERTFGISIRDDEIYAFEDAEVGELLDFIRVRIDETETLEQ
jgi:acyl carrier protein